MLLECSCCVLCLEKLVLHGEGEYNLNVVKEIEVTDAYLGLDRETINCQNKESLQECQTRFYHETILAKCGCLPFNLWNNNNKV